MPMTTNSSALAAVLREFAPDLRPDEFDRA